MNKRQKKKAVKTAMQHFGSSQFNARDKRVLCSYGREAFKAKYNGFEPEIVDIVPTIIKMMPKIIEEAKEIWGSIVEELQQSFLAITDSFNVAGKEIKNSLENNKRKD